MQTLKSSRLFTNLALITIFLTVGLIMFGAIVRVTDSGLGCGNEWPLCDGRIVPPLDNLTAWIEWSHRLLAMLIGLFGLPMLIIAFRKFRVTNRLVLNATIASALLYFVQSMLGAMVVVFDLPPTMVTLHLGTAMLLLAGFLVAGIASQYHPTRHYKRDHVTMLIYVTASLAFVIILTGALVRGSGATLACTDWPLCNGEVIPAQQGQLQMVHMLHRFAVVGLGMTLLLLVWYVWQERRQDRPLITFTLLAFALYITQALVGAVFVMTEAAPIWGVTHVGVAASTWACLVAVSVIETLNNREIIEVKSENEWISQSEMATNQS